MTPPRTILTTVGTSLLANATRDRGAGTPTQRQLDNYLRHTKPEAASAETNALSRLLQPDDHLIFLHSQTDDGRYCAEALQRCYASQGIDARLKEMTDLTYAESRFKMRGLRALIATLIQMIQQERQQGRVVLINATGGFKAEIAYATLIGLLFDVPVYYIHEQFRDIIEMPPTPIGWDYSLIADHEEFFEWIFAETRPTPEVDRRLTHLPQEIRLFLTEEDGATLLSLTGEVFYEAYLNRLKQAESVQILWSTAAQKTYQAAEPAIQAVFRRIRDKLKLRELRNSGSERVPTCDCLIYPQGHRGERIFYCEGKDGSVQVLELARHNDQSYERLLEQGINKAHYAGFQQWTDA